MVSLNDLTAVDYIKAMGAMEREAGHREIDLRDSVYVAVHLSDPCCSDTVKSYPLKELTKMALRFHGVSEKELKDVNGGEALIAPYQDAMDQLENRHGEFYTENLRTDLHEEIRRRAKERVRLRKARTKTQED